jgi:hypothetical protein
VSAVQITCVFGETTCILMVQEVQPAAWQYPVSQWTPPFLCRGKTNFFERRVGEYQKSSVMAGLNKGAGAGVHEFTTDCDF